MKDAIDRGLKELEIIVPYESMKGLLTRVLEAMREEGDGEK